MKILALLVRNLSSLMRGVFFKPLRRKKFTFCPGCKRCLLDGPGQQWHDNTALLISNLHIGTRSYCPKCRDIGPPLRGGKDWRPQPIRTALS